MRIFRVVEFASRDDMKYALKELDNEKLNGARVRLEEAVRNFCANKKCLYLTLSLWYRVVEDLVIVADPPAALLVAVLVLSLPLAQDLDLAAQHAVDVMILAILALVLVLTPEIDLVNVALTLKTKIWLSMCQM